MENLTVAFTLSQKPVTDEETIAGNYWGVGIVKQTSVAEILSIHTSYVFTNVFKLNLG